MGRSRWLLLLTALGCSGTRISPVNRGGAPGADGGRDAPSFVLPPASDATVPPVAPVPPGAEQCAEEAITAQLVPLDLVLVLDASGSMNGDVGGRTKWQRVQDALAGFVRDPRSAGLGVGLQVFPFTIAEKECQSDADCNDVGPMPNYWCQQPHICTGAGIAPGMGNLCDPNDAFCPPGAKCVQAGRCAVSHARCLNLGQPCPGGAAGDMCGAAPNLCKIPIDSCAPSDYEQPRVAIGELPAAEAALIQGLAAVKPAGGTPIAPAFDGAVLHLRKHLAAHADHRAALVLATDGAPNGCPGNDENGIAARLDAARGGNPALPTYVIGVLDANNTQAIQLMTRFATAGGTAMPFILNAGADLGQKLQAALDQIRAKALPCEFTIPAPTMGAIDYGRVNVRYTGPSGQDDLFYVTSADRCDPVKGGWYYDVPPAAGTPSLVHVCPATCQRFGVELGGSVQLRFGCRTRVIE